MFSQRIKQIRQKSGLSQKKFAQLLNVSQQTVGSWEVGRTTPSHDVLTSIASKFDVSVDFLLGTEERRYRHLDEQETHPPKGIKIPVLGYVAAGIPISAVEDILDYEEITPKMARNGEYFGLKIKGDSMIPDIKNGDVVIVRQQPDVESGEVAIVCINGDEATCKKVIKHPAGISIVSNNPAYAPRFFTNEEIATLPVTIIGKVIELRRTF